MASLLSLQSHPSSSSYLSFNPLPPVHTPNPPTHNFNIPPPQPPMNPSFAAADNNINNNALALSHAGGINSTLAQQDDQDGAAGESQYINNTNHAIVAGGGGGGGIWTSNLPLGVRFRPTDIELINCYLRPYIVNPSIFKFNKDHPITEAKIYDYDPHQLLGFGRDHGDGKRYFYTKLKKIGPSKTSRTITSKMGGWKPTQKSKEVIDPNTNTIIGHKRPLAFFTNELNPKTQWLMQEYFLQARPPGATSDDIVLAVVYFCRRRKRDDSN